MDPSALIFVALAVAWAVYLIPKALEHSDEGVRSRTVDRFSHTMRVLARREPVDSKKARLVKAEKAGRAVEAVAPAVPAPAPARARREAAARAARRRRNVLGVLLLAVLAVVGVAASGVIGWIWTAVPAAFLAAWLVVCRLMVKRERRAAVPSARRPQPVPVPMALEEEYAAAAPVADVPVAAEEPLEAVDEYSTAAGTVEEQLAAAELSGELPVDATQVGMWAPVPVTLPTYVSKPAARRTVRTIDLDSTGVWTSGRTAADSALAREADEAARVEGAQGDGRRATGS